MAKMIVTLTTRYITTPLFVLVLIIGMNSRSAYADCQLGACIGVGAELLSIDSSDGPVLNLLTQLLLKSTLAINVGNWEGVAQTNVNLLTLLNAVQLQANAGSVNEALSSNLTLTQLIGASITALQNEGDFVGAGIIGQLQTDLAAIPDMNNTIRLGELITLADTQEALLDIEINLLHVFIGSLQLFNSENTLDTPTPLNVSNASVLSALGLSSLASDAEVSLRVTEPPEFTCGGVGVSAQSASVRLKFDLDLLSGLDASTTLLAASVDISLTQLSLYLALAPATAQLNTVVPSSSTSGSISLNANHGIAHLYLGQFDDSEFFDPTYSPATDATIYNDLSPAIIGDLELTLLPDSATADISLRSYAHGTQTSNGLVFNSFPSVQTVNSSVGVISNLIADTLSNFEISIDGTGLSAILATLGVPLSQLVTVITNPIANLLDNQILSPVLTNTVDELLSSLGISIGKAVIFVNGFAGVCQISGQIYHDDDPANGSIDTGEHWQDGVPLWVHVTQASALIASQKIHPGSGDFSFSGLPLGTYNFVIAAHAGATEASFPEGWEAVAPATGTYLRELISASVDMIYFGLQRVNILISGRVFDDNGFGGGIANDGILNGSEVLRVGAVVELRQSGNDTVITSVHTDSDGNYNIHIPPNWLSQSLDLRLAEEAGQIIIGISPGNSGGDFDSSNDHLSFTPMLTNISALDIAFVSVSRFLPNIELVTGPGQSSLIPHTFITGTAGTLDISYSSAAGSLPVGWNALLFEDNDCDGALSETESTIHSTVNLAAEVQYCVILKTFVAPNAKEGQQALWTIIANFDLNDNISEILEVHDLITTTERYQGILQLIKEVDKSTALPGETLLYTIHYKNIGTEPLSNLIIYDRTPAFTLFMSSDCASELGLGLSACSENLPAIGTAGNLSWSFINSLSSGATGQLNFQVEIEPTP